MNNQYQSLFSSLAISVQAQPSIHLTWTDIDFYASKLLFGILGREIHIESEMLDFDWGMHIRETSITEDEMEMLYKAAGEDRLDRDWQTRNGFPATKICQGLSCKLLSKMMPYDICCSVVDDGVWLIGGQTDVSLSKETEDILISDQLGERRCSCGNTRFFANQVCYHHIIVDSNNIFDRNIEISESESPYGTYCCTNCGAEYEYLDELDKLTPTQGAVSK